MKNKSFVLYLLLSAFILQETQAQEICWKKHDPKNCEYSIITDFGISRRLTPIVESEDYYQGIDRGVNLDFNVGAVYHLNKQMGLGAYAFLDLDQLGANTKYGIRPRISYYPNDIIELNLSPGFIVSSSRYLTAYKPFGLSIEGGVNLKNHVGLYSRVDFLRRTDDLRETSVNLGIKGAGIVGAIGAGGVVVLGTAVAAIVLLTLFSILVG